MEGRMKIVDPNLREDAINQWNASYDSLLKDSDDQQYDNIEERRNIVNVEQVYIKEINNWEQTKSIDDPGYTPLFQPVRFNHKGERYETPGSTGLGVNQTPDGGQNYLQWRSSIISEGGQVDDVIK